MAAWLTPWDRCWGCHRCWHCVWGPRGADLWPSPPLTSPWHLIKWMCWQGGREAGVSRSEVMEWWKDQWGKIHAAGSLREAWHISGSTLHSLRDLSHPSQHLDCLILLLPPSVLHPKLQQSSCCWIINYLVIGPNKFGNYSSEYSTFFQ